MFSARVKPNARKSTHSGKVRIGLSSEDRHWEDTSDRDDPSSSQGPRSSTGGTTSRNSNERSIWDTQFTEPDLDEPDDLIWLTSDSAVALQPFPKAKIRGRSSSPKSETDRNIFSALGEPSSPSLKRVSESRTSTSHQYSQSKNSSRNFANLCGRSGKDFVFKKPTAPPPVSRVHLSGSSDGRQKQPVNTPSTSRSGLSQSRQRNTKRVHGAGVGRTAPTVPKAHAGGRTKRARHSITPPSAKVSSICEEDSIFNTKNVFEELQECLASPLTFDCVDEEFELLEEYEDTAPYRGKQLKSKAHHPSSRGLNRLEPYEDFRFSKDGNQLNRRMKGLLGLGISRKGGGQSGSLGSGMEPYKDGSTVQLKSSGQASPVNTNKSSVQKKSSSISTERQTSLSRLIPSKTLPQKLVKSIHAKSTSKQSPIKGSPIVALGKKLTPSSSKSSPIIDLCEVDILDQSEMTYLRSPSKPSPPKVVKGVVHTHRKANGNMAPPSVASRQVPGKVQSAGLTPKGIASTKRKSLSQKHPNKSSPRTNLFKIVSQKNLKIAPQKPSKTLPQKISMKRLPSKEPIKTQPPKNIIRNLSQKGATKSLPQKINTKSSPQTNTTKSLPRKETAKNLPQRDATTSKPKKDSNRALTHSTSNARNRVTSLLKDLNDPDPFVGQGHESPVISLNRLEVHLSPVTLQQEDAGEYDDIDGVLFASFGTQSDLESHLRTQPDRMPTHGQPETSSNSSPPETEECTGSVNVPVSFDQKQRQLVADLQKCSNHEILHPKLKGNGFSIRKELITKGIKSTNLRALGIRFTQKKETSASRSRRKSRLTECRKRPKTAKLSNSIVIEERTATPTTGLKIKFTLPQKNKPETKAPVDGKASEVSKEPVVTKDVKTLPVEESAPFKPFEKVVVSSKSAFVSDALEKYLQEEVKQAASKSVPAHPLLQSKAASVTFLMPCKQSSYIKTLDMALQQRQMRKSKSKVPTVAETAEKLAKNLKHTSDTLRISGLKQELPKNEDKNEDKKTSDKTLPPDSTKTPNKVPPAQDKQVKKASSNLTLVSPNKESTSAKIKEVKLVEKKRFLEEKLENVKKKLKESNALKKSPPKGKSQTSWATRLKIVNSRLVQQLSAPGRNAHLINSKSAQLTEDKTKAQGDGNKTKTGKRDSKRKRRNKMPSEFVRLDQQARCPKEFCQLGCVCESINLNLPVEKLTKHCRKSACMFECTCQRSSIRILRNRKRPTIFQEQSMLFYDGVGMFSNSSTSCFDESSNSVEDREKPGILGPNRGLCARAVVYKRKRKCQAKPAEGQSNPASEVSLSTILPKLDSSDSASAQSVSVQNPKDKNSQLQRDKDLSSRVHKITSSKRVVGTDVVPSVLYTPIQVPLSDKRGSVLLYAPVNTRPFMVQKIHLQGNKSQSPNADNSSTGILQITNIKDLKTSDNKLKHVTILSSGKPTDPAGKDSTALVSEDPSITKSDGTATSQCDAACSNSNHSLSGIGQDACHVEASAFTISPEVNIPANINPDNQSHLAVSENKVPNGLNEKGDPTSDTTLAKAASTLAGEMKGELESAEDAMCERTIRAVVRRTKSPVRSPTTSPAAGSMPAKNNLSYNQELSSALTSINAATDLTKTVSQSQPQVNQTDAKTNKTDVPSLKIPFLSNTVKKSEGDSNKPGLTKTQVFLPGKSVSTKSKGDSSSRSPLLVEIQSECNWIDTKNEILNTIAKHTSASEGIPGVVRVGKFLVEIQGKQKRENNPVVKIKKPVHQSLPVTATTAIERHFGPVKQPSTCRSSLTTSAHAKLSMPIPNMSESGHSSSKDTKTNMPPNILGPGQINIPGIGTVTTVPPSGKAPLLSMLPQGSILLSDGKNPSGYLVPLKAVHDQLAVAAATKRGPPSVSELLENRAKIKQARILHLPGSFGAGSEKNATPEILFKCPESSLEKSQRDVSDVMEKPAASSSPSLATDEKASTPAVSDESSRLNSECVKPAQSSPGTESVEEFREANVELTPNESSENSSSLENVPNVTAEPESVEHLKEAEDNSSPVETSDIPSLLENVPNITSEPGLEEASKEVIDDKGADGVQPSKLPSSKHKPNLLKSMSAPKQPLYPVALSSDAPCYQVPIASEATHQQDELTVYSTNVNSSTIEVLIRNPSSLRNMPSLASTPDLDEVSEEFVDVEGLDEVQPSVSPPFGKHRPDVKQPLYPVALISDAPMYRSMFVPIAPKTTHQNAEPTVRPSETFDDPNEEIDVVSFDDTKRVVKTSSPKSAGGSSQRQSVGSKRKRKSPVRQNRSVMAFEEPEFIESYFQVSSGEEDSTEEEPKKGKRDKPNKVLHLIKERQRRQDQRDLFGGLKSIMLYNEDDRVSKQAILEMAVKEVKQLESQAFSMEIEQTKLKQGIFQKRSKLASLLGVNITNFPTPFTDEKDPNFDDYLKELHDGSSPVTQSETTSQDSESVNMDSSDEENDIEEKTSEEPVLDTAPKPVQRTQPEVPSKNHNHVDSSIAENPPKTSVPFFAIAPRKPAHHLGLPKTIPVASAKSPRVMRKPPVSKSLREAQVSPKGPVPVALTALPFSFNMAPVHSTSQEVEHVSESVPSSDPVMSQASDAIPDAELKPENDKETKIRSPASPSAEYDRPVDLTVRSKKISTDKNVDENPEIPNSKTDSQTSPEESGRNENEIEQLSEKQSESIISDSELPKSTSEIPEKCDLFKDGNTDIVQGESQLPDGGTKENGLHGSDDDVEMINNDPSSEIVIVEDGGASWPPNNEKTGCQKGPLKKGNAQKVNSKKVSPEKDSTGSLNVLSIQTKGGVVSVTCDNGEVIPLALVKASSDGTMQVAVEGDISSEKVEELLSKTEVMECLEKVADDSCEK